VSAAVDGPEQAFQIVKETVLTDGQENLPVYGTKGVLPAGTRLETFGDPVTTLESPAWFVFIDLHPGANWEHACRYVFVDPGTGAVRTLDATRPPEMLTEMILHQGPDILGGQNIRPAAKKSLLGGRSVEHLWAVLLSGGASSGSNHVRYWNDCSNIYNTLVNTYGYLDDHIIVAISDGLDPAPDQSNGGNSDPDLDGDGDDDIMYSCVTSNLQTIFADLASTLGPQDTLFVFTTDHGSGQYGTPGQPTSMNLWNSEEIWDYEFAALVEPIQCREMIFTLEPCFSGGFVNDIINMNSTVPRVISTAANDHEYSWAMGPDYVYDTYVFHWTAAVNWEDAYGVPVDADYNADGEITMDEAYQYAVTMDEDDEHPQYDEWPVGYGATLTLSGSGPTSEGAASLDRTIYNCNGTIQIVVEDLDLVGAGTQDVTIESTTETTPETVTLTETDPGRFEGSITTDTNVPSADGILQVSPDDTITLTYEDTNYGGSGPMTVTDQATVDCTAPVISTVTVDWIGADEAQISWQTDEPCDSLVMYDTVMPPALMVTDDELTTNHTILLEGLTDCTSYMFAVQSTDAAGNMAQDDNGGAYYTFLTWELMSYFADDVENGENGWTYDGLWHIVPEASSCNEAHSPTHSWYYGQESTCTFNTGSANSGTLTSPIIDLTTTTQAELQLWYWFEGESSSTYDTVDISVQIVGGSATLLETVTEPTGGWLELVSDLTPVCGNQVQITVYFDTYDSVLNDYQGAYIDDIAVFASQPCEEPCINDGDVNNDESITAGDAQLAFQIALGLYSPTVEEACAADCNGDESITAGDAQQIFMTALGQTSCVDPL